MSDPLHCCHCGEVIGVYEPVVTLEEGRARELSLVVGPRPAAGVAYHRSCYLERHGDSALTR
jgi:hypothetical protein